MSVVVAPEFLLTDALGMGRPEQVGDCRGKRGVVFQQRLIRHAERVVDVLQRLVRSGQSRVFAAELSDFLHVEQDRSEDEKSSGRR